MDNPPSALRATSPTQGGKSMRRGFTLIELLVVVLIIGILAAVAVPQYQKAVEKARWTQALILVNSLEKEARIAYLAGEVVNDGTSTCEFESVSAAASKEFRYVNQDCGPNRTFFW